jgi:prepilin-type N-terminal cleavage/methylation domain-containing protein
MAPSCGISVAIQALQMSGHRATRPETSGKLEFLAADRQKTCRILSKPSAKNCHKKGARMKKTNENGFSLIELMIVCVVIGIVAAVAVPHLQKGIRAAENGNTFATMRTIGSTQMNYYSQNSRFGRITEINNVMSGAIGTNSGNDVIRGKFYLSMTPANPTDAELKNGYTITATRDIIGESQVYVYELTQSGEIRQILP